MWLAQSLPVQTLTTTPKHRTLALATARMA